MKVNAKKAPQNYLSTLLKTISDPSIGLSNDIFRFISQVTPLINVDLLINDPAKGTLLTWRDDEFYGPGWHVPGGIIRFKEPAETRIMKVAESELGITVTFEKKPIEVNEIMNKNRNIRGHFISLLYSCKLTSSLSEEFFFRQENPTNGYWQWFKDCPDNLIYQHEIYRQHIGLI